MITFENEKCYVGQTRRRLQDRMIQHCGIGKSGSKIKRAINKYKTFTVSILESNLTISQLNSFEKFYIKLFNSNGIEGYNLESGGMNKTVSDETKRKLSESHKGITFSDEHKRKLSETKKNMSDETKCKISEAKKGTTVSDETKEKLRISSTGKKHSDETRLKISVNKSGKRRTPETITYKKVKSIPDNIIFESVTECSKYYNILIGHLSRYYNGNTHRRTGQTFVLISE